jgi:hypothetical protein
MSWECAPVLPKFEVIPTRGFMVAASDLDCLAAWPQKFVLRPIPYDNPSALQVELYGSIDNTNRTVLNETAEGHEFTYEKYGLEVRGILGDYDEFAGADLEIVSMKLHGVPICLPGSYVLAPES